MAWAMKGQGKGKGKGSTIMKVQDPSKTIWIGGIPPNTHFKELLKFAQEIGPAKWADIRGKTGAIGYPSPQDAVTGMTTLNGAEFKGSVLQADQWTGKPAKGGGKSAPPAAAYGGGYQPVWKQQYQKQPYINGKSAGKGGKGKRSKMDPGRTVWIGNIPAGVHFKELLELAKTVGTAKWAEVWKGTGAVGFATEEETTAAITLLDGQALGSATIQADKWGTR